MKQENARLVRENNELHQQIIQVKEDAKQKENQYMLHLKSVEGQTQDLQFVNEQGQTRIRELEAENTALSKRLELAMIRGGD